MAIPKIAKTKNPLAKDVEGERTSVEEELASLDFAASVAVGVAPVKVSSVAVTESVTGIFPVNTVSSC